jgi:lysophospholipase L1-like esterase
MKTSYKLILSLVLITIFSFTVTEKKKIRVYLIGDSTISIKETKAYPETGWGMPFVHFFDSTVVIDNRAKNGRSTRSFLQEGLWQPVVDKLQEGDYVFIQFGHNDESKEKVERYTTVDQYKTNLMKVVIETRARKGIPVLLTPVSRRYFDSTGKVKQTHLMYSDAVREVAKANKVPLIDLDERSRELYQKLGDETSKLLFLQLKPGEHPNYPEGKNDNTHFNELGARLVAQIVLSEMKKLNLDLVNRIIKPAPKK